MSAPPRRAGRQSVGLARGERGAARAASRPPVDAADPAAVLAALPAPVIVVDRAGRLRFVNPAAEQFLGSGALALQGSALADLVLPGSALLSLVDSVWHVGNTISGYDVLLEGPRIGSRLVTIQGALVGPSAGHPPDQGRGSKAHPRDPRSQGESDEGGERLVLSVHERAMAEKLDRHLTHTKAARSLTAMAAMLAHEVKNPLSGIRGAAQLLEQDLPPAGRELTRLICEETDRIVALLDRMEGFADPRPIARECVNIHEVLERVRRIAQSGFARHVRLIEEYDPSLPPVRGDRDLLVQVFLNLVKNAAEAVPSAGGEIVLTTAYRHGLRLAVAGGSRRHLPLMVGVADNGPGIPEELRPHLFDPFVTTKRNGSGLGLALVAKLVGDHGGVVEFDSEPRRTVFRVFLPVAVVGEPGSREAGERDGGA
jgi:two-component system nitrogen regulation sensor histidine kinase GlnL